MNTANVLTQTSKNTYEGETMTMTRETWDDVTHWVLRNADSKGLGCDEYAVNLADLFDLVLVHD
jgi:hypothetical protein